MPVAQEGVSSLILDEHSASKTLRLLGVGVRSPNRIGRHRRLMNEYRCSSKLALVEMFDER
jgi:hypothetical protein